MKKVLVFYENMGGGHKRAARILEQALDGMEGVTVETVTGAEFFENPAGATVLSDIWNTMLSLDYVETADAVINFAMRVLWLPLGDALESTNAFRLLSRSAPDVIVSAADVYNKALGTYAEARGIPFIILETDVSVFIDLVHPHARHVCLFEDTASAIRSYPFDKTYFSKRLLPETRGTERLRYIADMYSEYVPRGRAIYRNIAPRARPRNRADCVAVGPLATAEHFERRDRGKMKGLHDIAEDRPCILVASGSIGGRYVVETTRALVKALSEPTTIVALCGRSKKSLRQVRALADRNPAVRVIPLEFVSYVHELLAAADVAVVRPSAGVVSEALLSRTPVVLPARVLSNDRGCVDLVRRHQLGEIYSSTEDVAAAVDAVLGAPSRYIEAMDRLLVGKPQTFEALCQRLREVVLQPEQELVVKRPLTTTQATANPDIIPKAEPLLEVSP